MEPAGCDNAGLPWEAAWAAGSFSLAFANSSFHGCFLSLGKLGAVCWPMICTSQGQAAGCVAEGRRGSRLEHTAPPRLCALLAGFAPALLSPVAAACGGCLRCARAARLFCVSLCKRSRALGLHFSVTAHPMSDPLQILTANSYANYLISCLIYFLCHHVFSTSPRPGGCGFPGLGGGRSRAAARRAGWAEPSSARGRGVEIPRSRTPRCGVSGTRKSCLLK